jgi:hypothetical protein
VLTIIPKRTDRTVDMMSDFLAENFGRKPRAWLTERV